jgi:hypothetical protein
MHTRAPGECTLHRDAHDSNAHKPHDKQLVGVARRVGLNVGTLIISLSALR